MEKISTNEAALINSGKELDLVATSILYSTLNHGSVFEIRKSNFGESAIHCELDLAKEEILEGVYSRLKQFASEPDFADKMNLIFGNSWNRSEMTALVRDWRAGDFEQMPDIDILTGKQLNGANAAFCGETNTIYVSDDFLLDNANSSATLTNVLLEEMGHAIDFRINEIDAAGDEGDIFQRVVQGMKLSHGELLSLKTENDHSTIILNGEILGIEMSRIAVESFKDRLYQSVRGTDNIVYTRFSVDGESWTEWIGYGWTADTPELEVFNDRLYQSIQGTDNVVYTRSTTDGNTWSEWVGNGSTWDAPELEVFNGRLYQSVRGTNQDGIGNVVYTRSTADGSNWTEWVGNGSTRSTPTLTMFNNKLFQTVEGTDSPYGKIYSRYSTDPTTTV